jgi:N-acetylmuramoyl-L-alanine amidase
MTAHRRLALVPGHGWRARGGPALVWDPGAVGLSGQEAVIVRDLASALQLAAPDRVRVFDSPPDSAGTYTDRRTRAHAWLGVEGGVVLHLHCNGATSAQPHYSMTMHDPRSRLGAAAATSLASALRTARVPDVRVVEAARPTWAHAANLVEPTWAAPAGTCAVLLELGFVSSPVSTHLYTSAGLRGVASAILAGL